MDFNLTEDIDSDLLHWDDDDEIKGVSDQDNGNKDDSANSETKQDDQIIQDSVTPVARSTSSLDRNPNNYFTATTFADQALSTLPLGLTKSNVQSFLNSSCLGSTSAGEFDLKRVPQQLADQNNFLEPLFPPNYFLSGAGPWDPSQAVMNPQAKASKTQGASSNHSPRSKDMNDNLDDKKPAAAVFQPQQQQEDQWGSSQISQRMAVHQQQVNQNLINQNAQNLVAAAAAAAAAAHLIGPEQNSLQGSRQTVTDASTNTGSSASSHPSSSSGGKTGMGQTSSNDTGNNNHHLNHNEAQNQSEIPPFYLFDAPCELRANFLQAQRQHEAAPVEFKDSNSFHYGMAINGYHPQMNTQVKPIMPASLGAAILPNGERVPLVDRRRKHKAKTTERNEREQQRAQKITELIDKLRNTMEQGGWKVEMKSKYQILSTSANYLKHLIKSTKEKERNLQKTRAELAIRNQKLEEDRVLQDGRSDPESVTSSLTACSFSDSKFRGSTEDSSTTVAVASLEREGYKRKGTSQGNSQEHKESKKKCHKNAEKNDDDSNHDSNNSSGNMDSNNSGSGHDGNNISIDKMSSSLSDITDSNRGSSDGQGTGSSGSIQVKAALDLSLLKQEDNSDTKTHSSISSTAAVVSGVGSNDHDHRNTAIIFTRDRKRKHREKTSMEDGFQLSYQEVFLASNVPQLIATPAGRIVACNDFFFRVTGLTAKDVKKITIFSMVEVDQLSNLFDLVADSLRKSNSSVVTGSIDSSSKNASSISSKKDSSSSSKNDSGSEDRVENNQIHFETATLACVPFPQELIHNINSEDKKNLFMNVTFMYDENPSKRCIHCALTDKPGTGGKIGAITPQLLSMLFPYGCATKAPPNKKPCLSK